MTEEDLKTVVQTRPFVPVRIGMTNGSTYDLTHPDGILIGETVAAVAVGRAIALVSIDHINEIHHLPTIQK